MTVLFASILQVRSRPDNKNDIVQMNVEKERTDICLFPNPTNGKIQLEIPAHENEWLSINAVNVYGKKVKSISFKNTGSLNVDLSDLSSGMYILSIQKGDELLISQKIVRN